MASAKGVRPAWLRQLTDALRTRTKYRKRSKRPATAKMGQVQLLFFAAGAGSWAGRSGSTISHTSSISTTLEHRIRLPTGQIHSVSHG
eukprot:scaffold3953_cov169-Amphora_coffeaeformis.AAC.31